MTTTVTVNPARALLRDLIRDAHPAWNVVDQARTPDAILKDTALVWTSQIDRTGYGATPLVGSTVDLWLIPKTQDGKTVEDDADALLSAAVELIEDADGITWATATRGAIDGVWHGWHLTLTITHTLTKET